jgi:cysteine synthase
LRDPGLIPEAVKARLPRVSPNAIDPLNLFRITWKNDPVSGLFGGVNFLEIPREITGVKARIIGLAGRFFPTGAHKVGAAFGCLVPRLVSGEFDPAVHKAAWPSTGNYCRGGAFDCAILGCKGIAILPEQMSRERFEWLKSIGAEIIVTPGGESNVKEIYDKCWELKKDPLISIFNQFEEFGNPIYHYAVTGPACAEAVAAAGGPALRAAAYVSATGSAGTIAAGDFLKKQFPGLKIIASEALQCPTLLLNGFGEHRIEGIGDKHVPWVHNVRNTDGVAAIDDEDCMRVLRLFNEPAGRDHLLALGVGANVLDKLSWLGISGICNVLASIKTARHFELDERDAILTVFTDSTDLYRSRLEELRTERGPYRLQDAIRDHAGPLAHQGCDNFRELGYWDRKAIHNLKYFTWVEQQGKTSRELAELWEPDTWRRLFEEEPVLIDKLIDEFNAEAAR